MSFPIFTSQRFFKFRLSELFDVHSPVVEEYADKLSIKELADVIIIDISYPFHLGQPDDTHIFNAFHGDQKWCERIDLDYWQKAAETLTIRVGDCEDSSVAFVTCARVLGLKPDEVYEAFGIVKDASTGQILGGHGWAYFKDGDKWRLVESTLDAPPEEYPVCPDPFKPFQLANVIYEPEMLFNDSEYHDITTLKIYSLIGERILKKRKETPDKWKALSKAHQNYTKPDIAMRKSLLAKLRNILRRR